MAVPSLTVIVIVAVPLAPLTGVRVTVRFAPLPPKTMLASGTNAALLEVPVTVKAATGLSRSAMVNAMAPVGVFSGVVWSFILVIVGGSLFAFTVKTKLIDAVADPSDTVIVMVDVPLWLPAGVIITVRLAPVPLKTMLASGTTVALLDVAANVRSAGSDSASPIEKPIADVGVSSNVV